MKEFILNFFSGFFSFLGEILIFFGVIMAFKLVFNLLALGLFFLIIGQLAGVNAMKYKNEKELLFFKINGFDLIGREFVYPTLVGILFLINKEKLFMFLSLALGIIALVKSIFILYKISIIKVKL